MAGGRAALDADARYPPSPNGHYDARGRAGRRTATARRRTATTTPARNAQRLRAERLRAARRRRLRAPPNGEAPPRFLTPADVPNGHDAAATTTPAARARRRRPAPSAASEWTPTCPPRRPARNWRGADC